MEWSRSGAGSRTGCSRIVVGSRPGAESRTGAGSATHPRSWLANVVIDSSSPVQHCARDSWSKTDIHDMCTFGNLLSGVAYASFGNLQIGFVMCTIGNFQFGVVVCTIGNL